jgi:hypothetical protein
MISTQKEAILLHYRDYVVFDLDPRKGKRKNEITVGAFVLCYMRSLVVEVDLPSLCFLRLFVLYKEKGGATG